MIPTSLAKRLALVWAAVQGRPIAYRLNVHGGISFKDMGAHVDDISVDPVLSTGLNLPLPVTNVQPDADGIRVEIPVELARAINDHLIREHGREQVRAGKSPLAIFRSRAAQRLSDPDRLPTPTGHCGK